MANTNGPKNPLNADRYWRERGENLRENRGGGFRFTSYHGKSWIPVLGKGDATHHETVFASHTFHEIQMYYPMRVVLDDRYKLIWNIASGLPYPFASDLWVASSWQAQFQKGLDAPYGKRTVREYIHRPAFELYDLTLDPDETKNLAGLPEHQKLLETYKKKLKDMQERLKDPWIVKWRYE